MTLKDLESQLLSLTFSEKEQAIQLRTQSLGTIWTGIEKTSRICGGNARIANTRITIWGLVNARQLGYSDGDLLQSYPQLTAIDLVNAWNYTKAYPDEISLAIQENETARSMARLYADEQFSYHSLAKPKSKSISSTPINVNIISPGDSTSIASGDRAGSC
jgi:uncharacterized protein (DUF433 family)